MIINSAIFVSDLHLAKSNTTHYHIFLKFLESLAGRVEYIFFLGDIFEFWFNDKPFLLREYSDLLSLLEKLSNSGTKFIFFEGNHDVCYGSYIKNKLKAKVFRNCVILKINDYNIFLGHGDELVKNDLKYKLFRMLLRSSLIKHLISLAPPKLVLRVALSLSKISRALGKIKKMDLNEQFKKIAYEKFKKNIDVVILGHSHIAVSLKLGRGLYLNCGSWLNDFSYIEFRENSFSLKSYKELEI